MTRQEQHPSPEEMQRVFGDMLIRMRNYAFHHLDRMGPRTYTSLQELDLFGDTPEPIGAKTDMAILRETDHPLRRYLPAGPLVVYMADNDKSRGRVVELPILLYSELLEVRETAMATLGKMIGEGGLEVTPKTKDVWGKWHQHIVSENPHEWRSAAIAINDALYDDVLIAIQGVRQSLATTPPIQESLNFFVPRTLNPTISSIDSIALEVKNPEAEHVNLKGIIRAIASETKSLKTACSDYYLRLGYLPLAPAYAMGALVSKWLIEHTCDDVWGEIWDWAGSEMGPIPRYHACSVFVLRSDLIPEGKMSELWGEILRVLQVSDAKQMDGVENETWTLRRDLTRHYAYHVETNLPENAGANISAFAWWLSERVVSIFSDAPEAAQFYRKNWIEPAADLSARIWFSANPRMGMSFLRYVTFAVHSPWASGLLALMGDGLDNLLPSEQPVAVQKLFHDALISQLISLIPFPVEESADPTYCLECPIGKTALRWASVCKSEEQRNALEQLVETSRALGDAGGICDALKRLADMRLPDQIVVALALKAKAYTDPVLADSIWPILDDREWRTKVLGVIENRVLGLVIEAFGIMQTSRQDLWFTRYPHYIAELCEQAEDVERRRQLFLYVIYASLTAESVSPIRRLLGGDHKQAFVEVIREYREHVEGHWAKYPQWVQSKMRGFLASLHIV